MQQSEGGRLYIYLTWEKKDAAAVFWDLPAKEMSFQSLDDIRERERERVKCLTCSNAFI